MLTFTWAMERLRLTSCSAILLAVFESATLASEPATQQARFVRDWGSRGTAPGQFDFPIGVAVDHEGRILVTDFDNACVQRFSPDGKFHAMFKVLPNAGGITVDRDGDIYLTHFSAMKLKEVPKPGQVTVS
jgi:NHL repeat